MRGSELAGRIRRRRRHALFSLAGRLTPYVAVEAEGLRYVVSTRDQVVGRWTYVIGHWEKRTTEKALAALAAHPGVPRPLAGSAVLEIGANIGTQTVRFLRREGASRVICFEPSRENARLLRMNLAANDVADRGDVHVMALSDEDGFVEMEVSPSNFGDHRVRVPGAGGAADAFEESTWSVERIPAARLDTLVAGGAVDLADVALVWMDAQGHEAQILAAAGSVLERGIPIVTELWPYGLRRAGGLERFAGYVREHFREFVEIRSQSDDPPVTLPASAVDDVIARYEEMRPHDIAYTDVLLVPRT